MTRPIDMSARRHSTACRKLMSFLVDEHHDDQCWCHTPDRRPTQTMRWVPGTPVVRFDRREVVD